MKKILVISNNNDDLNTISAFLEDLIPDCLVIPAQSGIVGIESTKAESPEMVLLDLEIGEIDPCEVCRTLKSEENTKQIPVLLMTDIQSDPKSYVKGFKAGATGFLGKPVDKAELAVQVDMVLRKKKPNLKSSFNRPRKWNPSGPWQAGSHTNLTIFSFLLSDTPRCACMMSLKTAKPGKICYLS